MTPGFNQEIWRGSHEYLSAYEEGYNAAKQEILSLIKPLQALRKTTGTTTNN